MTTTVSPETSRGLAALARAPLAHILNEVHSRLWPSFQKAALSNNSIDVPEFRWLVEASRLSNDIQIELQNDDEDLILESLFERSVDADRIWAAINDAEHSWLYQEVLDANAYRFQKE